MRIGIKSYYSNKEIKKITFFNGLLYLIRKGKIKIIINDILISIFRLQIPLGIFDEDKNTLIIYFGINSNSQKKIKFKRDNNHHIIEKIPITNSALKYLENEKLGIIFFHSIGINTMEPIKNYPYGYSYIEGIEIFSPKRIYNEVVSKYPTAKKMCIYDYGRLYWINIDRRKYELLKNRVIEVTVCHGDLTYWNTIFSNNKIYLIDIERFKFERLKYFDVFYYILSYFVFVKKHTGIELFNRIQGYLKLLGINQSYSYFLCLDVYNGILEEAKDGYIYTERNFFLKTITSLIQNFENKINK